MKYVARKVLKIKMKVVIVLLVFVLLTVPNIAERDYKKEAECEAEIRNKKINDTKVDNFTLTSLIQDKCYGRLFHI